MNDDDDIAATMSALPNPGGAAPKSDDEDIAGTLSSLDKPASPTPHAFANVGKQKTPLSAMTYAQKVAHWESGGDANAKNSASSATGSGQFIDKTWLPLVKKHRPDLAAGKSDAQLLAMRNDPDLSAHMTDAFADDNSVKLQHNNIPVNDASKYGAHWFGPDNFSKIYGADPGTPVDNIIGKDAAAKNGLSGKTTDDVKQIAAQRMGMGNMPQSQDWSDTLAQSWQNLLPSVGHMAAGIASSVMHPVDTFNTLKQVGLGLKSKVDGWAGRDQEPDQKASDEALVDALGHSYKEKYGSIDGFKNYLAHDPAGVLFDASTVLTSGGGIAARAPGVIGKAGEIAGAVGKAVNPLNPLGAVSKVAKAATAPAAVFDATGNVVPKVDSLIRKVTNKTMTGADLVDPDVKSAFAASLAKKGVNEATVREALLKSLGLKAPTSTVTGAAAPSAALPEVSKVINENNEALSARARALGPNPTSPDLGSALDDAHTQSMNRASGAYEAIRQTPGSFGRTMPEMGNFGKLIKQNLQKSGVPTTDLASMSGAGYTQTAAAIKYLKSTWGSGKNITTGNGVDAGEILAMRKALNNFRSSASGSDIKGMSDVTNAFDTHVSNLATTGYTKTPNGATTFTMSPKIGKQIGAANSAYKTHFDTFENSNGANNSLVNAVQKLKSGQTRSSWGDLMPSGDQSLYTQAQAGLVKDLAHPTKGAATMNMLGDALGTAPDDMARARHIQAARVINNTQPKLEAKAHSLMSEIAGRTLWKGVASLVGEHALGPVGAVLGPTVVEPTMEHLGAARGIKKALAGAPNTRSTLGRAAAAILNKATSPMTQVPAHYVNQAQEPENQVVSRASGGKVDNFESLVVRLMNRSKAAKREVDETTKPLLHVPDDTIIRALKIAQEHI